MSLTCIEHKLDINKVKEERRVTIIEAHLPAPRLTSHTMIENQVKFYLFDKIVD